MLRKRFHCAQFNTTYHEIDNELPEAITQHLLNIFQKCFFHSNTHNYIHKTCRICCGQNCLRHCENGVPKSWAHWDYCSFVPFYSSYIRFCTTIRILLDRLFNWFYNIYLQFYSIFTSMPSKTRPK